MVETNVLHIHAPMPVERRIFAGRCPDCKRRTRFLAWFYEWYGWNQTCLRCGRQWSGGEWLPAPFCRGWRTHNIREAKDHWRRETRRAIERGGKD